MILVDTSVWVERDRNAHSVENLRLTELLASDKSACVTEPIEMELLAGSGDALQVRRLLLGVESVPFDSADFSAAARIHVACSEAGHRPRGIIDCMIAAVAVRAGIPLLARDRDFARIAAVTELELIAV